LTYGAPRAPIRVRAASNDEGFTLEVANQGEPIPPHAMEKLFAPFSRGQGGPNQQGLGLGLYIASEIASAHGGRIDVVSSTEETRFTLRIPR
jgi:signal transduction histidine kinase